MIWYVDLELFVNGEQINYIKIESHGVGSNKHQLRPTSFKLSIILIMPVIDLKYQTSLFCLCFEKRTATPLQPAG